MKIEVGKSYETRDGLKATILAILPEPLVEGDEGALLYLGYISQPTGNRAARWSAKGTTTVSPFEPKFDLVSEWKYKPSVDWSLLPRWARFVAVDSTGGWWFYSVEPTFGLCGSWLPQSKDLYCSKIPPGYCPAYSGDWADSLVERGVNGAPCAVRGAIVEGLRGA